MVVTKCTDKLKNKKLTNNFRSLPGLDVLRGFAALGVAWFHSRVDLWVGFKAIHADPSAYSIFDRALSYFSLPVSQMGGVVMLFFVLSGFCIHLPIASKIQPPNWSAYAVRRFLRIYPAYLIVLLLCLLAAFVWFKTGGNTLSELNIYLASSALAQNWLYGGHQIAVNPSLWTIPVEVEAYLFYPILLWILRRQGVGAACAFAFLITGIGVILFSLGLSQANTTFFKYGIIWSSGAWLAEAYTRGGLPKWTKLHLIFMVCTAIVTIILGLAGVNVFYLHYGWAICSFLLLFWVLEAKTRFLLLANKWWIKTLSFSGTISYSLYLIHFPLFKLTGFAWIQFFGSKPESFLVPTLATILVVPIAWVFYRLIELPSHDLARKLGSYIQRKSLPPLSSLSS